jgi:thiamine-monophosphate kinase
VNELELIAKLTAGLPTDDSVVVGAGDDCAVLEVGIPDRHLLFKTDAVVQDVHFTTTTPPWQVGRKALARCLSDIAAMGGVPASALVTLGLPADLGSDWAEQAYAGLCRLAEEYRVTVTGGETTSAPHAAFLGISLIGSVGKGRAILRSGAKPGDAIFVTGELGGSLAGRHLDFEPRVREACWVCEHFHIHSMIDLSDGLATDLRHMTHASGTGATLRVESIPVSRAAKLAARERHDSKPPVTAALTDGEDFELLFTVAPGDAVRLLDAWKSAFPGLALGCIGQMTAEPGIHLQDQTGLRRLGEQGYQHSL